MSIDLENNFKPKYISNPDKTKVISELKKEMKKCKELYIASDFDREGEAIGWHLTKVLKAKPENTKVIFTEITKTAIQNAVQNPTQIDQNMFQAQQARRILDRIIGYLISPILWKQIQSSYKEKQSLSAGRVQSVVVKLIKERKTLKSLNRNLISSFRNFSLPLENKTLPLSAELNKDINKKENLR